MIAINQQLFLWLNLGPHSPLWLLELARFASLRLQYALLVPTLAVALFCKPVWRAQALRVLASVALAWLAVHTLKPLLDLPRPFALGLGTLWLPHGVSPGFPSAHACAAMAFAVSASRALLRSSFHALLW